MKLRAPTRGPIYDNQWIAESHSDLMKFYETPIHSTIGLAKKNLKGTRFDMDEFRNDMSLLWKLENLLANQTSDSIDDFIIQNPNLADFAKVAIASVIFLCCYRASNETRALHIKPLAARRTDQLFERQKKDTDISERNWVHHLINIAREKYYQGAPEVEKRMRIITFNYDTVLEHVLDAQFRNTEHKYGPYTDYFHILHVHGRCGLLSPEFRGKAHEMIEEWAQGIHVVRDEAVAADVEVDRALAAQWVSKARYIHCVGFSFATANVKLLGLDKSESICKLNYCNFNGSVGVKMNAAKCIGGFRDVVEDRNDDSRPLRVSDWFATGYAGELPS